MQKADGPLVDKDTWWPKWHVIQIHYRSKDKKTYVLGFIGHPEHAPSIQWCCKVAPHHAWCYCDSNQGFDGAIRTLLKFHGLPTGLGRIVPCPHHWRDEWLDLSHYMGDANCPLTENPFMKPKLLDRFVHNGPIARILSLLRAVECSYFGVCRRDFDHE